VLICDQLRVWREAVANKVLFESLDSRIRFLWLICLTTRKIGYPYLLPSREPLLRTVYHAPIPITTYGAPSDISMPRAVEYFVVRSKHRWITERYSLHNSRHSTYASSGLALYLTPTAFHVTATGRIWSHIPHLNCRKDFWIIMVQARDWYRRFAWSTWSGVFAVISTLKCPFTEHRAAVLAPGRLGSASTSTPQIREQYHTGFSWSSIFISRKSPSVHRTPCVFK
jgi:hypothetical protein